MKESLSRKAFNQVNIIFMVILSVITIYPMLYVAFASVSKPGEFLSFQGVLLKPQGFSLLAYKLVLQNPMVLQGYINTVIVLIGGVSLNLLLTAMGAYVLSRKGVLWRNTIMLGIVFTMFFSGGMIPFYLTVKQLHLDNSLLALIIPSSINTINLIILRTAFAGIPASMEESCKLDGAGHFTILWKVFIPLSLPTMAVMVLYYGVAHWNAWFNAMLFITKRELFPLQLVLREVLVQSVSADMTMSYSVGDEQPIGEIIKYALIIIATVPVLLLYPFLQKYFVKGVLIGALKE